MSFSPTQSPSIESTGRGSNERVLLESARGLCVYDVFCVRCSRALSAHTCYSEYNDIKHYKFRI